MIDHPTTSALTSLEISKLLDSHRAEIVEKFVREHTLNYPDDHTSSDQRVEDAAYHLSYLSESIAADDASLFADYVTWAHSRLDAQDISQTTLSHSLECLRIAIDGTLSVEYADAINAYLLAGMHVLKITTAPIRTQESESSKLHSLAVDYLDALLKADRALASQKILEAAARGVGIRELYLNVFQWAQHEIGRLWQVGKLTVAQEHYATAATQLIISQLYPYVFASSGVSDGATARPRMIATCISQDAHELGVRMIADFFEMEGFDTIYLGANVPHESIIKMIDERKPHLLAVSATMTFHVRHVRELIASVREHSRMVGASSVYPRILVGGYPFTIAPNLWKNVGADLFARDAQEAIDIAKMIKSQL